MEPSNPKTHHSGGGGRAHWYPYYAGYSTTFVSDILTGLDLADDAVVLDPWNGSGTTTTVCSINGVLSTGFDLNPAMIVVAKARLLAANTAGSLTPLLHATLEIAKGGAYRPCGSADPLLAWFMPPTASRLRAVERAIHALFVTADRSARVTQRSVDGFSSLAAFYYVLLFRLVRKSLRGVSTTNPTWIKSRSDNKEKIRLTWDEIASEMKADLKHIHLQDTSSESGARYATADVKVADSRFLPLADRTVDAVITSPPYCTRIDYAVATRAELAVLNIADAEEFEALRRNMLGTTLSSKEPADIGLLSAGASRVLEKIRTHPSKASASYYFSTFCDYFGKLENSLSQIDRVMKVGGAATFVVQDSSYKDVHIDLAEIVSECFIERGFRASSRWDFPVIRSMRQIHTISRNHGGRQPTESVLTFIKD